MILEFALSATYLKGLLDVGWCLSENTYSASIGKLNEIEPGIKMKIESQKMTAANMRPISELQEKGSLKCTSCARSSNNGGGGNNSKHYCHYRDCPTCH